MSQRALQDYLNRVTSRWCDKPKYMAMLALILQPFVDIQNLQALLDNFYFDLDTAIGPQLDAVGVRVGLSRKISVPLPNLYFSVDDPLRGVDQGFIYNPLFGNQYAITSLDDTTYRQILRAKILANYWDGTLPQLRAILTQMFAGSTTTNTSPFDAEFDGSPQGFGASETTFIVVQDDSTSASPNVYFSVDDASAGVDQGIIYNPGDPLNNLPAAGIGLSIGIAGNLPPLALLFLLEQQSIPIKPSGVPLNIEFTSINGAPLFGVDVDNEFISGVDRGAVGVSADFIVNAPPASIYPTNTGAM